MSLMSALRKKRLYLKRHCRPTQLHVIVVLAVGLCLLTTRFYEAKIKVKLTIIENYSYKNLLNDLQDSIIQNEGRICIMPKLDPFAMPEEKQVKQVHCENADWVKCFLDECYVVDAIKKSTKDLFCVYQDMMYFNEFWYDVGKPLKIPGNMSYKLRKSDHVKVSCSGVRLRDFARPMISQNYIFSLTEEIQWLGYKAGFRRLPPLDPPCDGPRLNILMLGFNCLSKNAFIRQMQNSYMVIKDMGAVFLDGYNTVGDGNAAALFPIFSGKSELEFPENGNRSNDLTNTSYIFKHLSNSGYRTAFFKDSIDAFQRYYKVFHEMPDHYLYPLLLEAYKSRVDKKNLSFCMGPKSVHKLMLELTYQFFQQSEHHFAFTFMGSTCHDEFTTNSAVDLDLSNFLKRIQQGGRLKETVLFIMGDHGPKYAPARLFDQGRLEERLPLMAIIPPDGLKRTRPDALEALEANADVLTTPFDIHSTLVDILGMGDLRNQEKIPKAIWPRGMSLLQHIPRTRSCGEAGILPHWCACTFKQQVDTSKPVYHEVGVVIATYINKMTMDFRNVCAVLELTSIMSVERQSYNEQLGNVRAMGEFYKAVVRMSPGRAVYEVTLKYFEKEGRFEINPKHVTRINAPGNTAACVTKEHPHLIDYCYCKNQMFINE